MDKLFLPILLTSLAGLSTTLGAVFILFTDSENKTFLSGALGFSAGLMIYISFMEMMPDSIDFISQDANISNPKLISSIWFFLGIAFIAIVDRIFFQLEGHDEINIINDIDLASKGNKTDEELKKIGVLNAIAIGIHNFPEGFITFMSTLANPRMGILIAVAIAIHNIPEGLAVAVPIYQASGSKKEAFKLAFLSGLSEPIGGIIGYLFLSRFLTNVVMGGVFAFVSGLMVFISLHELLPTAYAYNKDSHLPIYSLSLGMFVMAATIIILG